MTFGVRRMICLFATSFSPSVAAESRMTAYMCEMRRFAFARSALFFSRAASSSNAFFCSSRGCSSHFWSEAAFISIMSSMSSCSSSGAVRSISSRHCW